MAFDIFNTLLLLFLVLFLLLSLCIKILNYTILHRKTGYKY